MAVQTEGLWGNRKGPLMGKVSSGGDEKVLKLIVVIVVLLWIYYKSLDELYGVGFVSHQSRHIKNINSWAWKAEQKIFT